jgi:hypothetical protein
MKISSYWWSNDDILQKSVTARLTEVEPKIQIPAEAYKIEQGPSFNGSTVLERQ